MIKLLIVVFTSLSFVTCFQEKTTAEPLLNINEEQPQLSKDEKLMLKEKQEALKQKYVQNWKDKTKAEKKAALTAYKEELDEYCQKEFGHSYDELKDKYRHYFKRILPN
mgnify:CR=1 FL=1